MAIMFGQNATYDSIEGRFRSYRKIAEQLKAEARARGVTDIPSRGGGRSSGVSTPRTPRNRGSRGGIGKCTPSTGGTGSTKMSTAKNNKLHKMTSGFNTPSKKGKSMTDAICLVDDSSDDEDQMMIKIDEKEEDEEVETKIENEHEAPLRMEESVEGQYPHASDTDITAERGAAKRSRDLSPRAFARKHRRKVDSRTNGYVEAPSVESPVSSPVRRFRRDIAQASVEEETVSSSRRGHDVEMGAAASPLASKNQSAINVDDDDMSDTA